MDVQFNMKKILLAAASLSVFGFFMIPRASAQTQYVSIRDNFFSDQSVAVAAGTTVVWRNDGSNPHTVTEDTGKFDSGMLTSGNGMTYTFYAPGTYQYYDKAYGRPGGTGMSGRIIVSAQNASPQTGMPQNQADMNQGYPNYYGYPYYQYPPQAGYGFGQTQYSPVIQSYPQISMYPQMAYGNTMGSGIDVSYPYRYNQPIQMTQTYQYPNIQTNQTAYPGVNFYPNYGSGSPMPYYYNSYGSPPSYGFKYFSQIKTYYYPF
jgi:plastocyanin